MSGTLVEEPRPVNESVERDPTQRQALSVPHVQAPSNFCATRSFAGLACAVGLLFLYLSNRPLGGTTIWGHLAYGRGILQSQSLPPTEPLLPLAKGMPFVDTAWLSQLIGIGVMNQQGVAGMTGLYAASVALCVGLLAWRSYCSCRNSSVAAYAVLAFFVVAWESLTVIHVQLAGLVCFVALLARFTSRRPHGSDWLLVPVLFATWANLHASFVMGLTLLVCFCLGRALDVLRRTGSLRLMACDDRVRRNFLLLELAAVAVLLNPYGPGLYAELVSYCSNPNLRELVEWRPLTMQTFSGQMFVLMVVLLAMVYRGSPRRVRSWEVLALVGFGVAAMWSGGNLIWWAPIAALLVAQHASAALRALQHQPFVLESAPRRAIWTLVSFGVLGICFALSPLGTQLLTGKESEPRRAATDTTPIAATEYLRANPPQGLVFNVHEWGDYLQWAGPPGIEVFVNSHVHLVPIDVWQRYLQVLDQRGNWEEVLDRFAVNVIVLDTRHHAPLVFKLKRLDEVWNLAFEQDGQVVLVRRKPL